MGTRVARFATAGNRRLIASPKVGCAEPNACCLRQQAFGSEEETRLAPPPDPPSPELRRARRLRSASCFFPFLDLRPSIVASQALASSDVRLSSFRSPRFSPSNFAMSAIRTLFLGLRPRLEARNSRRLYPLPFTLYPSARSANHTHNTKFRNPHLARRIDLRPDPPPSYQTAPR